jgi:hypothetical protein
MMLLSGSREDGSALAWAPPSPESANSSLSRRFRFAATMGLYAGAARQLEDKAKSADGWV